MPRHASIPPRAGQEAQWPPEKRGLSAGRMGPPPAAAESLQKLYLEITTHCNLDCRMCIRQVWREPGRSMSPQTFQALIGQLRAVPTVREVQFGGFGEPTVHPQFLDFLSAVKQAGLEAEIVTNGIELNPGLLERFVDLAVDRLIVSLDRASASSNGVFHPEPARVMHNLRQLYRTKLRRRADKPELTVQFVATKANIEELPQLKRAGQLLGFERILVTNLVAYDAALSDLVLYQHWATAKADTRACSWNPVIDLPRLDPRSKATPVIEQLELSGSNLRLLGCDPTAGGMYCRFVHQGRAAIDPDGNLSPCLALLHSYQYWFQGQSRRVQAFWVGNINQRPIGELWHLACYQEFRDRVRRWTFAPCIDCGGCELRESNQADCFGNGLPSCGACLWAAGIVQCP